MDLLTSGIFASHFINTVSPRFLWEIVEGWHPVVPWSVREEIRNKYHAGCASGILNAPDASYNPKTDDSLVRNFTHKDFWDAKCENKIAFQQELGLDVNADAPLFFWPSRLDPVQKGPQLVTDILVKTVSDYWDKGLQLAVLRTARMRFSSRTSSGITISATGWPSSTLMSAFRASLRGLRFHAHALTVRALRPATDDGTALWIAARGSRVPVASTIRFTRWM